MARHGVIYAPAVLLLVIYLPPSLPYVIAFFFFAHFYKLGRYLVMSMCEKKKGKEEKEEEKEKNLQVSSTRKSTGKKKEDDFDINV